MLNIAAEVGGHSFDTDGADYTHRDNMCSFEVLIDAFDLTDDPALVRLAAIVHAADIDSELNTGAPRV